MKRPIDPNLAGFDGEDVLGNAAQPATDGALSEPKAPENSESITQLREDVRSYQEAREEAERLKQEEKEKEHLHRHHRHHKHHRHHRRSGSSSGSSGSHSEHSGSSHSEHTGSSHSGSHSHSHSHSHSSSHSSKKSKKNKLPTVIKVAIIILLVLLLAVGTVFGTFLALKYKGKKDIMPTVTEQTKYEEIIEYNGHKYKYNENVVSLAFIGVDQRELEDSSETDFVGAADADLVIAVDTETGTTRVIAIPRDTMVDIDMYSADTGLLLQSKKAQLCLAYAYGDGDALSCQNTVDAMSRVLNNVPIQKYFTLDLDGIAPLNDAIGGVQIPNSLYPFPDYGVSVGDPVMLKGDMAERYVRTRDADVVTASLNRTERQVQYVKAYSQQALPAVMRDFSTVSRLYSISNNYSKTNLSLSNATYIASLLLQKNVRDFTGVMLEGEMKGSQDPNPEYADVVHAEFYPDKDFLMQTVLDTFYTQIE